VLQHRVFQIALNFSCQSCHAPLHSVIHSNHGALLGHQEMHFICCQTWIKMVVKKSVQPDLNLKILFVHIMSENFLCVLEYDA
jgi:hypothetical protein